MTMTTRRRLQRHLKFDRHKASPSEAAVQVGTLLDGHSEFESQLQICGVGPGGVPDGHVIDAPFGVVKASNVHQSEIEETCDVSGLAETDNHLALVVLVVDRWEEARLSQRIP